MKDTTKRDRQIIDNLRKDNQRLTDNYFLFKNMLSKMYEVASAAITDNDVQIELNTIMMEDHFMRKQIPPNGNYTEEKS